MKESLQLDQRSVVRIENEWYALVYDHSERSDGKGGKVCSYNLVTWRAGRFVRLQSPGVPQVALLAHFDKDGRSKYWGHITEIKTFRNSYEAWNSLQPGNSYAKYTHRRLPDVMHVTMSDIYQKFGRGNIVIEVGPCDVQYISSLKAWKYVYTYREHDDGELKVLLVQERDGIKYTALMTRERYEELGGEAQGVCSLVW